MISLSSGWLSYIQAKLTSWLFQLSCCIRGLCQLSVLFNLGQQDTDSAVADTVVFLHLLNIGLFHQSHAFCYQQQPYHGGNGSPVLVTCQWWAKLHGLCSLSQCCRCDLWPLISMAFVKLTGRDEIAFCCARSLLWDKRANSPGEFICHSHLRLETVISFMTVSNKKLMPLREGEGRLKYLLSDVSAWFLCLYLHESMNSGLGEVFFNAFNARSSSSKQVFWDSAGMKMSEFEHLDENFPF